MAPPRNRQATSIHNAHYALEMPAYQASSTWCLSTFAGFARPRTGGLTLPRMATRFCLSLEVFDRSTAALRPSCQCSGSSSCRAASAASLPSLPPLQRSGQHSGRGGRPFGRRRLRPCEEQGLQQPPGRYQSLDQEPPSAASKAVISCMAVAVNQRWSARQALQASFRRCDGDLGLLGVLPVLDAAYVGFRSATQALCTAIRPNHPWCGGVDCALTDAMGRVSRLLPPGTVTGQVSDGLSQGRIAKALRAKQVSQWREAAEPPETVRLNAYSATGAGKQFALTPSRTLDKNLSSSQFATSVATFLGVDVTEGGEPCCLCGMLLDAKGLHLLSCMCGGESVYEHNGVRDVVFDFAECGGLRPKLEETGLLATIEDVSNGERPADILILPNIALARRLPDGSRAVCTERICVDFAIINALGAGHWRQTALQGGSASEAYADQHKCRRKTMEARCRDLGLRFWPAVFEYQGGRTQDADELLRAISFAVAEREGADEARICDVVEQRIAVVLARSAANRLQRRARGVPERPAWSAAAEVVRGMRTATWQ